MLVERRRGETKTFKKSWNSETCLTTRRASPVACNIYIYIYRGAAAAARSTDSATAVKRKY